MTNMLFPIIPNNYRPMRECEKERVPSYEERYVVDRETVAKLVGGEDELARREEYCHLSGGDLGETKHYGGWLLKCPKGSPYEYKISFPHLMFTDKLTCAKFFQALTDELRGGEIKIDQCGSLIQAA